MCVYVCLCACMCVCVCGCVCVCAAHTTGREPTSSEFSGLQGVAVRTAIGTTRHGSGRAKLFTRRTRVVRGAVCLCALCRRQRACHPLPQFLAFGRYGTAAAVLELQICTLQLVSGTAARLAAAPARVWPHRPHSPPRPYPIIASAPCLPHSRLHSGSPGHQYQGHMARSARSGASLRRAPRRQNDILCTNRLRRARFDGCWSCRPSHPCPPAPATGFCRSRPGHCQGRYLGGGAECSRAREWHGTRQ